MKNRKDYDVKYVTSTKGRAVKLINGAKRRGGIVSITADWVAKKIENGVCELTGFPFCLKSPKNTSRNPFSPSLDRIDNSSKEYSEANTRVVLSSVNVALNEFGEQTMLPILTSLVKAIEKRQCVT